MIRFVADVRPFRGLRYSPALDLAKALCPPFDTISPQEQKALHDLSPHNAVRIELALGEGDDRYRAAAAALRQWRAEGALQQEPTPCFYVYDQRFEHGGRTHVRRAIFVRLRLEPWGNGVLPHEHTFGGPKEDRLRLLRATRLNASPVFLIYRDRAGEVAALLAQAASRPPEAAFVTPDGQRHELRVMRDEVEIAALQRALAAETLYVADGHHRYETALGYRDECRAAVRSWTGQEPENFVLAALSAASDPGLLVLPIHRLTTAGAPLAQALARLSPLFDVVAGLSPEQVAQRMAGGGVAAFGLAAAEAVGLHLLTLRDKGAVDAVLPQERSTRWRELEYAIANYAILRYGLGLQEAEMSDYKTLGFTENADEAVAAVRHGRARYAVLMRPVPVARILDVADAGERMPQKSTFFYPKVPTGLVFNPLED